MAAEITEQLATFAVDSRFETLSNALGAWEQAEERSREDRET
jgi:hypothetical protein